ncbi:hypothetical protein RMSM_02538 [Rhodopirellula maiorica SM1]|uniref:Uncharacterized protein n=1 Tax=Rhodopirellula maiorica SM1 TaxID=1265738 RepID=M5RMT0_9BACT|nr:hypothetical protein [Rhodopirellula maiorica]EMI20506.1 hypothetical protein RMSM_02538 [Rhodopirellula maiorica SM1]
MGKPITLGHLMKSIGDYKSRPRRVIVKDEPDYARRVIGVQNGKLLLKHCDGKCRVVSIEQVLKVI